MGASKKKSPKIYLDGKDKVDEALLKQQMAKARARLIDCFLLGNCTKEYFPLKLFLQSFEEDLIRRALELSHGNQRVASLILGTKATTLNEKIKRLHISNARDYRIRIDLSGIIQWNSREETHSPNK